MGVVDTHQLRSFLVVRYGTKSAPKFGVVQEKLQPADNKYGDEKHQAGQDPYSYSARDDHPSHNFHSRVLERGDLGPEIVRQRLKTSSIHQLIVGFLQ